MSHLGDGIMYYYILDREFQLIHELQYLFYKKSNLTIKQIKEILDSDNKQYNLKEINLALNYLLVVRGNIIRDDYFNKEPIYKYVTDKYYHNSSYTKHYYSFEVNDCKNNQFLLISDTHIGENKLENLKLLSNIYKYASKKGVETCDLISRQAFDESEQIDFKKIFCLLERYCETFGSIKTYSLMGNHDMYINNLMQYDLRMITGCLNNFYIIPRKEFSIDFADTKIHFSHKLYLNWLIRDKLLNNLEQIEDDKMFYNHEFDVLISGHLHKGFIYNYELDDEQQLLLGVPSTSNLSQNGVVAYIVSLEYDQLNNAQELNIEVLKSENSEIVDSETINWKLHEKNKLLKKIY